MRKIIQNHKDCIGCGTCVALCPEFWEMNGDGKVRPKLSRQNSVTGNLEFEVEEKDASCNKEAADSCPVQVIEII